MEKAKDIFLKFRGIHDLLDRGLTIREIIFWLAVVVCLLPGMTAPIALVMGLLFVNLLGHPYAKSGAKATDYLLQFAVVGLGFGISAEQAFTTGKEGFIMTFIAIICTLGLGLIFGKLLKIDQKTSFLVAVGTAICGGSAIAAVSPAIKARQHQISMALGAVFVLNSLALFLFPPIGKFLGLGAEQFGTWCAIAIHDTSSVVGAASQYSDEALKIATTVKLTRALWIIPVAFLSAFAFGQGKGKIKIPYFIGLFILAVLANSFLPSVKLIAPFIDHLAHMALCLSIFLIGCGLSRKLLFAGGLRVLGQASILWVIIAGLTLLVVAL
ncbi:YeiH family protein [Echinicola strongylocentroti]|nr:putative sulfate exporter family transporter [Echinicola strongylocentroti]